MLDIVWPENSATSSFIKGNFLVLMMTNHRGGEICEGGCQDLLGTILLSALSRGEEMVILTSAEQAVDGRRIVW